jgi:hypothetical protein
MKKNKENITIDPGDILAKIHSDSTNKNFDSVLNIIQPIRRKADFWDMAEKFYRRYGYNFRFEIRKHGTEEQNEKLIEIENRIYNP